MHKMSSNEDDENVDYWKLMIINDGMLTLTVTKRRKAMRNPGMAGMTYEALQPKPRTSAAVRLMPMT